MEPFKINVHKISMADYEQHHYEKQLLKESAMKIGDLEVTPVADLEQVRGLINRLQEDLATTHASSDWCFIDSCTAERFFRIDRAQEHLHYVTDISSDCLYILDSLSASTDEDDSIFPSVQDFSSALLSSEHTTPDLSPNEDELSRTIVEAQVETSRFLENHSKIIGAARAESDISVVTKTEQLCRPSNLSCVPRKKSDEIIIAAKMGDLKLLKELHGRGHSLLSQDESAQTALHYSARYGYADIVKYIIARAPHAVISMVDNEKGQTALHKAASYRQQTICCMLVAGGASLLQLDNHGNTAKTLALQANDYQLAAYLESQEQYAIEDDNIETTV